MQLFTSSLLFYIFFFHFSLSHTTKDIVLINMILLNFTNLLSFSILDAFSIISRILTKIFFTFFICILASGSVVVAMVVGAIEGHTTDIGFLQGCLLGAMAGFITAVQLFGTLHNEEPLSKVALVKRVVNGKAVMGLVRPALLKAYQWQITALDTSYTEVSNMYDITEEAKGLSKNSINNIPMFYNCFRDQSESNCPICLQDWEEGERGRKLEKCGHIFHMICIDQWLLRHVTCPICRHNLL